MYPKGPSVKVYIQPFQTQSLAHSQTAREGEDVLDPHNRKKNVPYSAEFAVGKLKHLLFLKPCGVGCTVVERASRERPGSAEAPAYATRVPLSLLFRDSEGSEGHTRSFIPDLAVMRGFERAFVVESRREGFEGALGWVPGGIGPPQASGSAQREGHPDSEERERRYRESARQELVSLWETEEDARLGGEWMAMSLRGTFTLPHRGPYVEHAEVCAAL